jgi:hypothetical protein
VPSFASTPDSALPFYNPMSRARRIAYTVGFVWTPVFWWRGRAGESWLEQLPAWFAIVVALCGLMMLLRQRRLLNAPNPEEGVSSYRRSLAEEIERQFRAERRVVSLLFGGMVATGFLRLAGHYSAHGTIGSDALAVMAFGVVALSVGGVLSFRAEKAILSRLRGD